MAREKEFYNFAFEVEGELPIFIAKEKGEKSPHLLKAEARYEAAEIYEVKPCEVKFLGVYTDEEADEIGYDTY